MMKIYILRHGEAVGEDFVGGSDEARILTPKGEDSVRHAAQGMTRLEIKPEIIWTSPLSRAAQTARITAEVLRCEKVVKVCKELEPGADPGILAGLIQQETDGESVMLVGHNPDLELFVQYLISETDQANISLKKGGLVVIEVDRPIHQGCGTIISLWTPKQLAKLAE